MSFKALLYTYILGGLTFIPLLLAAILIPAWLLLPQVEDDAGKKRGGGIGENKENKGEDGGEERLEKSIATADAAAEGTFAVLRKYDFSAANAALTARHSSGNIAGGTASADGSSEGGSGNQSTYWSVFDRGRGAAPTTSVLENDEDDAPTAPGAKARKRVTPANVFYIVLRHGHLMLYDSAAQVEVRHVISLAHHTVSLSEDGNEDEQDMRDGDLFIKRTAIVLTPVDVPNGQLQSRATPPKPFYLFSTLCSEKEDFYHALLYTRSRPPIPEPIAPNDAIKLQSALHSSTLTAETRALNAIIGRVFLALYQTDHLKNLVQSKVERKISRVQKPAFISSLDVQSIDLGDATPVISNPKLKDLNISGDMTVSCDVRYTGGVKLTIAAVAKIDLGARFKTRTVDLVLASSLQRLQGKMLVRIKPPPSNRLWFCFEAPPEMEVRVEPVVSQRRISYNFILRQIEDRIRAVVAETLVKPNWDDVPFFDTSGQTIRGGIWRDQGIEDEDAETTAGEMLAAKNAKTKSMPALPPGAEATDSSATSSGSESTKIATGSSALDPSKDAELKRRSVASLPARSATTLSTAETLDNGDYASTPPRPLRSPSFASPTAPSISRDESPANVDARAPAEAAQARKSWRIRPGAPSAPVKKEAVDAMREVRDRVLANREAAELDATAADEREGVGMGDDHDTGIQRPESVARSDTASTLYNDSILSPNRTDSAASSTTTASHGSLAQQRKQNILAATAAATSAARNWSWNAIANARARGAPALQKGAVGSPQQEPMGRGQPLPPPGTPLPGPQQKGIFGGLGSVRRKPVPAQKPELPPRRSDAEQREGLSSSEGERGEDANSLSEIAEDEGREGHHVDSSTAPGPRDDFGPWEQNSGDGGEDLMMFGTAQDGDLQDRAVASGNEKKSEIPMPADENLGGMSELTAGKKMRPPLPPRPQEREEEDATSKTGDTNAGLAARSNDNTTSPPPTSSSDAEASLREAFNLSPSSAAPEKAEVKFALGGDVREEDFEHSPGKNDVSDAPAEPPGDHLDIEDDHSDWADEEEKIVAIPAPIDSDSDEGEHVGGAERVAERKDIPPKQVEHQNSIQPPAGDVPA